ncbi:MAG: HEPN/Toprim-associated domain-containing protein [Anaerolineae bacterium]
MGNYGLCWLDDFFVGSSKNDIDTELISLFRAQDKIVRGSPIIDLPIPLKQYRESIVEDPTLQIIYYEASIDVIRDRLNVLGYDIVTAKEAFRAWIKEELNQAQKSADEMQEKDSKIRDLMGDYYKKIGNILSSLSPDIWMENLKEIREAGIETNYYGKYEGPYEDTAIGYMLSNEWYGYPGYDLFVPLRLAIDSFESSTRFIYDLTDLVWSGYFDYKDDFIAYGAGVSASEYRSKAKTIILTEGKTDARILEEALDFLYPHLKDYFSFLDFESTGFGGGVGNLANVVKAFAGAGIVNNVIALFDNDTAAASACKGLENITMPSNITIRHLPELSLLRSYPTVGPSGTVELNINGIAASIELYLGEDVLRLNGTNLVPIQWMGYDPLMKKYQGEVLGKAQLQARFREKLTRARNGDECDWQGLRAVFHMLFTSFLDRNRSMICKRASEYYTR